MIADVCEVPRQIFESKVSKIQLSFQFYLILVQMRTKSYGNTKSKSCEIL